VFQQCSTLALFSNNRRYALWDQVVTWLILPAVTAFILAGFARSDRMQDVDLRRIINSIRLPLQPDVVGKFYTLATTYRIS
jgi:hypothetical protein